MKVSFYVSLHNCLCRTDTPLPISHSTPNNIRNTGQILLPWITLIILTHVKWWWSESRSAIVWLFATSWTIQSMEFSRPAYWYWHIYTAAAAAAKSLQSCPTLCDPIDGSTPGSPSLGFSRQEHWSGLPFPSPMHESEKWKWSCSVVSDSLRPHSLQTTRLLRPWDFPGKSTGEGCHCLLPYIHYHI